MKLTLRAKLATGVLVGVGFAALFYNDIILAMCFVVLLALIGSELVWAGIIVSSPNRFFRLWADDGVEISRPIPIGQLESRNYFFAKTVRSKVSLSSELQYLKIQPSEFGREVRRKLRISLDFRSPYAGVYSLGHIKAKTEGPLGFISVEVKLKASLGFRVYPKVYDVALASSKILGKSGIGEIPIDLPGIGTEFYDIRQYLPGDDLRNVNWKASARLGGLIVNDRAKEVGASYYLLLESSSSSFFDRDRLASTFLQIANILAVLEVNFGFMISDQNNVRRFKEMDRPFVSLGLARSAAMELVDLRVEPYEEEKEELLATIPSHSIRSKMHALSQDGLTTLSEIEKIGQLQMESTLKQNDSFRKLLDLIKENPSEPPAVVYVCGMSSMFPRSQIAPIIEASSQLRNQYNAEFIVIDPTAPWIPAEDENRAAGLYESRQRNLKILRDARVQYHVGEPLRVAEEIFLQ